MTYRFGFLSYVALAASLTACGDWGYSDEVKNNYIKGCNLTNTEVMRQVCECSFDEIKESMPYKEFKAMDDAIKNKDTPDSKSLSKVAEAMKTCSAKMFIPGRDGKSKK